MNTYNLGDILTVLISIPGVKICWMKDISTTDIAIYFSTEDKVRCLEILIIPFFPGKDPFRQGSIHDKTCKRNPEVLLTTELPADDLSNTPQGRTLWQYPIIHDIKGCRVTRIGTPKLTVKGSLKHNI